MSTPFKKASPGCCSCTGTCTGAQICVQVDGCNGLALAGATVTISLSGTTIGTGTSDGTGKYCHAIASAATYTIVVSMTGFNTSTTTYAAVCSSSTNNPTVNLTAASGYVCTPCCAESISTASKTLTTTGGTFTLAYLGNTFAGGPYGIVLGTPVWGVCVMTSPISSHVSDPFCNLCNPFTGFVSVSQATPFFFYCQSGWHLQEWAHTCPGGPVTPWSQLGAGVTDWPCSPPDPTVTCSGPAGCGCGLFLNFTGGGTCSPLSITFSINSTFIYDGTAIVTD